MKNVSFYVSEVLSIILKLWTMNHTFKWWDTPRSFKNNEKPNMNISLYVCIQVAFRFMLSHGFLPRRRGLVPIFMHVSLMKGCCRLLCYLDIWYSEGIM